jgi:hypothetical protein
MSNPGGGDPPTVTVKEAKHMKIPLFYGRSDGKDEICAEDLIGRIEALCKATGKGDDVKIQELYLALRDDAVKWYKALEMQDVNIKDWTAVKKQFLTDYQFKIEGAVAFKWEVMKQKPNEKVVDYFSRVNEEIEHYMEGVACRTETASIETRKHFQKGIFIGGLREEIRTGVLNDKEARQSLIAAKKGAQTREYVEISKRRTLTGAAVSAMKEMEEEIDRIGQDEEEEVEEDYEEDEIALINRYRSRIGRRPLRRGGARGRGGAPAKFTGKCYNCDKPGHRSADCRQPRRNGIRAVDEDTAGRDDREERLSMIAPLKNW